MPIYTCHLQSNHITNNEAIFAIPLVARATHVLIRDLYYHEKLICKVENDKALA